MDYFVGLAINVLAVIFVFSPHEFAHAFVAYKNGDPTAKLNGRMTLNPVKHIEPVGFIACALVGFGWARPVPINPGNFKSYKKGMFTTAVAGVIVNYIIAFFAYLFFALSVRFILFNAPENAYYVATLPASFFYRVFALSLCSFVFNLLPLYPLDGFRVVEAFTRQINPVQKFLKEYGNVILILLIVESFLCDVLARFVPIAYYFDVLGYFMKFATDIIGYPIRAAWGWII